MSEDAILGPYRVAAEAAGMREEAFRRESDRRLAELEHERAEAWRRLNFLAALCRAEVSDDATALESRLLSGLHFMEMLETALDELDDAGREIAAALHPVAVAVQSAVASSQGGEAGDVVACLATFENWYRERFAQSFWQRLQRPENFAPPVEM